ncbi:prolactin-inducible protein homolog [Trichosurus vulpecula]|uniref:prolactin-inducible protein homolog n=1 Tax=Trichosurus vulpecula TaxID=9337 RepID=UPI00186B067C|nr:prolactin-inducible protein homolog [Trichosurus vulpecula]
MSLLQALMRCSITALFLGLCLQLITGQDEDSDNRRPLIVQISPIPSAKAKEMSEIRCNVSTELRECVAVKLSVETNQDTHCSQFYDYEACICPGDRARNFYWNICSTQNVYVGCAAEITSSQEICTKNISVVPTRGFRIYSIGRC